MSEMDRLVKEQRKDGITFINGNLTGYKPPKPNPLIYFMDSSFPLPKTREDLKKGGLEFLFDDPDYQKLIN